MTINRFTNTKNIHLADETLNYGQEEADRSPSEKTAKLVITSVQIPGHTVILMQDFAAVAAIL
jgi:hypothetical protein